MFYVLDFPGLAAQLATSASARLPLGFRPSTLRQYTRMWRDFLAFQVAAGLPHSQVNSNFLLSFMEYLYQSKLSSSHIANYMAALRSFYIINALDTTPLKDERIPLFLKSIKIQAPFAPTIKPAIDVRRLESIIQQCHALPHSKIFQPLYLLSFFSFLRLSNILPHTTKTFDPTRQLARGDFILSNNNAVLLIKWSKTLQDRKKSVTIPLPSLGSSPLCPIKAITNIILLHPAGENDSLFVIPRSSSPVPLTDSMARKHLKKISIILGLHSPLTFHAFRRAGAMWAFQNGVPLEHIMKHGTWKSDAVWTYLSSTPSATSPVSLAFQASLHS